MFLKNFYQSLCNSKLIIQKSSREGNMLRVFRTLLFLIATISLLVTSLSCHRTPIEPEKIKANLIYEDALCTEAYLRLKLAYIDFPANVDLYVDKNKVNSFRTFSEDTVIMVENLLPKKSYTSYVRIYPSGGGEIVSNEVSFTTMDTTSHNFTWQVFEFGNFGTSILYDVAIINENDIWAVGEIYVADTSSTGYTMYNAVHWDGNKWELKQILYKNGFWPIRAVYAFNSNDIWFSGYMRYYNGRFFELSIPDILIGWGIDKIWGTSSNDIYAVGDYGNIAHWDGKRWTKIESGTDVRLRDIYGNNLSDDIYIVGHESSPELKTVLLHLKNGKVTKVWETCCLEDKDPYGTSLRNLYIKDNWLFTLGKRYIKENIKLKTKAKRITNILYDMVYEFKGTDKNDIYSFTDFGEIFHYNGYSIKLVFRIPSSVIFFYGGNAKDDIVVGVGGKHMDIFDNPAILVLGKRK
jgi:hypothetical protein